MTEYSKRLKKAMEYADLTQVELAHRSGVKQQSIQYLLTKGNSSRYNSHIAHACGVDSDWLATGKGEMISDQTVVSSLVKVDTDTVKIPLLTATLSMGNGIPAELGHDDVIKSIELTKQWINSRLSAASSTDNINLVTAMGDSMKGTFNHGDLLFVDSGVTDLKIDAVYAVRHDGQLWIKRIQRIPGGRVKMISDNRRKYPDPIIIEHKHMKDFHVIGRVIGSLNFHDA